MLSTLAYGDFVDENMLDDSSRAFNMTVLPITPPLDLTQTQRDSKCR